MGFREFRERCYPWALEKREGSERGSDVLVPTPWFLDVQNSILLYQFIPKVTAFKELSGEGPMTLNEVRETGVLQLLEQVVSVQLVVRPGDLVLTTSSRCVPSYSFHPRFLDIVQTLAPQECPTRPERPPTNQGMQAPVCLHRMI